MKARLEQLEGFLTAGTVLIVKAQATGSGCEWGDANCNLSAEHPQLCIKTKTTPLKINGWNMSSWRFGSDHLPFQMGDGCRFQPLIFQGLFSTLSPPKKNIKSLASCIHLAFAL